MAKPARSLRALPKAHLHVHLEGAIRPSTAHELLRRRGVEFASFDQWQGLTGFMERYHELVASIQSVDDMERICRDLVEDEAAQGTKHLEVMFNPRDYARRFRLDADDVFELMHEAFSGRGHDLGVSVAYLFGFDRAVPLQEAHKTAELAIRHHEDGVVGYGFGGDEYARPPREFQEVCDLVRRHGLMVIPHAGETRGADGVYEALELQPARLAHGVAAASDPALLRQLRTRRITCDVAVSSNLRVWGDTDISEHPLPRLLEAGVPVTLNADDPLFFGHGILDEYELARTQLHLSDTTLAAIAHQSFAASALPAPAKQEAYATIDSWLGLGADQAEVA